MARKVHGRKGRSQLGKSNGRWKSGRSKTFRRRVAGAKPKDGKVVHHKNKKKSDNRPSNFKKVTPGGHNRLHPEKGGGNKKK